MNLNKPIRDFLVGTLLGDAHIRKTGILGNQAYITFEQSLKKNQYIQFLLAKVKEEGIPIKNENLTEYVRNDKRYDVVNKSLYFRTESSESLSPIANLFLNDEGKKIVPHNIKDYLTTESLAFWIMDDGQRVKNGGVTLCTDSYSKEEVSILREALKNNFNLESTIHNKKSKNGDFYERIYIKKDGLEEIKSSLIPYMDESMLYKLNVTAIDNSDIEKDSDNEDRKVIKQDSSDIVNDSTEIDIFDIGGS